MTREEFKNFIENANLSDDAVFASVVKEILDYFQILPGDIGNSLRVSRPTIMRWKNGVTSPHPLMREPIRRFALRNLALE
jgi:hypothetical protein